MKTKKEKQKSFENVAPILQRSTSAFFGDVRPASAGRSLNNYSSKRMLVGNAVDITGRSLTPLGYLRMGVNSNELRECRALQTTMALVRQQMGVMIESRVDEAERVSNNLINHVIPQAKFVSRSSSACQTDICHPDGYPKEILIDLSKIMNLLTTSDVSNNSQSIAVELNKLLQTIAIRLERLAKKEESKTRNLLWCPSLVDPSKSFPHLNEIPHIGLRDRLCEKVDELPFDIQFDELIGNFMEQIEKATRAADFSLKGKAAIDKAFNQAGSRSSKMKLANAFECIIRLMKDTSDERDEALIRANRAEEQLFKVEKELENAQNEERKQRARASIRIKLDSQRLNNEERGLRPNSMPSAARMLQILGLSSTCGDVRGDISFVGPEDITNTEKIAEVTGVSIEEIEQAIKERRQYLSSIRDAKMSPMGGSNNHLEPGGNIANMNYKSDGLFSVGSSPSRQASGMSNPPLLNPMMHSPTAAASQKNFNPTATLTSLNLTPTSPKANKYSTSSQEKQQTNPYALLPSNDLIRKAAITVGIHPECIPVYPRAAVRALAKRIIELQNRIRLLAIWARNSAFPISSAAPALSAEGGKHAFSSTIELDVDFRGLFDGFSISEQDLLDKCYAVGDGAEGDTLSRLHKIAANLDFSTDNLKTVISGNRIGLDATGLKGLMSGRSTFKQIYLSTVGLPPVYESYSSSNQANIGNRVNSSNTNHVNFNHGDSSARLRDTAQTAELLATHLLLNNSVNNLNSNRKLENSNDFTGTLLLPHPPGVSIVHNKSFPAIHQRPETASTKHPPSSAGGRRPPTASSGGVLSRVQSASNERPRSAVISSRK